MGRWIWMLALVACSGGSDDTGDSQVGDDDDDDDVVGDDDDVVGDDDDTMPGTTAETGEPPVVLPPYDDIFLWQPITFDDAVDNGYAVTAVTKHVDSGPIVLTEIGSAAGLDTSVAGGNSHGVGVGFFDYDGDGWEDILVANGQFGYQSQAWHNNGDGTFTDVSVSSGLLGILMDLDTYSVAAGDYDDDGDLDVHITAHPTDILMQNQGDGTFVDVTAAAGLGGPDSTRADNGSSKIGAWGDYDNDGWLDMFVASSTFDSHPPHGYLMHNNGDGTFSDVTTSGDIQISTTGNPCAVIWTDYDNDGWQDLNVWNDRGDSNTNRTMLRNDGDGTFTDVTSAVLFDLMPAGNPMGIDGADVNRDGFLDYYVGNIGGNLLPLSRGDGTFINSAAAAGVLGNFGWGLGFEDFDHDGWWDIFVAQEDDQDYLSFKHNRDDPPTFAEGRHLHAMVGNGHNVAVAFADFDHDLDVDVVTASTSGSRLSLLRNDTVQGSYRWLEVVVPTPPGNHGFGGVSGRVVVKTGDNVVWRDISGGSSRASQNAMSTRFGLGDWTGAEWVAVVWPTGEQQVVLNVEGDQVLQMPTN